MQLRIVPITEATVTTHIIVTTNLLTLTNTELEATIETELAENPALEMEEALRCPRCSAVMEKPPCMSCLQELLAGRFVNVETGYRPVSGGRIAEDDFDPMMRVAQPRRLADHVLSQLRPQLASSEMAVASFLAESLDENGFLSVTLKTAAQAMGVEFPVVEKVLLSMQKVDPVGVGSRTKQECLLRQLEVLLERDDAQQPAASAICAVAHRLIDQHWDAFLHGRWDEIPLTEHQVTAAVNYIRCNLTPYPALANWEGAASRKQSPAEPTIYSRPDMAVYVDGEGKLSVEIFSVGARWLRLSPSFRQMIKQQRDALPHDEWVAMAERARLFIKCLGQRQQTLRRAVEALICYQENALLHGDAYIRPLTRTQLAKELNVHEATISRAVMGKTIALPDGRILPLSHFFESGKSTKELIRQIIADEQDPLSDSDIATRLKQIGHPIARRTVAKYRNMLGILPVHLRARQSNLVHAQNQPLNEMVLQ